jgi:wyosine [tRNA(Phe)-imidazoG37] synthetase (radical SAM superfamily)
MQVERQTFYKPEKIFSAAQEQVRKAKEARETVDFLTFVPDGEPTLDINLGCEIELLRLMDIKVAVITNASLIWHEDVRAALMQADWVSLKMDAVREDVWRREDRPHGRLRLEAILRGALEFARDFEGQLVTETMLVTGLNDAADHIREVADFLANLRPDVAYLAIPTRPPAEKWAGAPDEAVINQAYQILNKSVDASGHNLNVEYLIGYEGNAFASTGKVEQDLLNITSVHPMRQDAVSGFLERAGTDWSVVETLLDQQQLVVTEYEGHRFYLRRFHK